MTKKLKFPFTYIVRPNSEFSDLSKNSLNLFKFLQVDDVTTQVHGSFGHVGKEKFLEIVYTRKSSSVNARGIPPAV